MIVKPLLLFLLSPLMLLLLIYLALGFASLLNNESWVALHLCWFIWFLNTDIFKYPPLMGISWSPLLFVLLYVYMLESLTYRLHGLLCTQVCEVNMAPLGTRVLRGWESRRLKSRSSGLDGCSGSPWPLRAWESGPWHQGWSACLVSLAQPSQSLESRATKTDSCRHLCRLCMGCLCP